MKLVINFCIILNVIFLYSCKSNENKTSLNENTVTGEMIYINDDSDSTTDSVRVIDRDFYFLSDSTKVERTINVDHRKVSNQKKQLLRIDSIFNSRAIFEYKDYISPKPFPDSTVFNPFQDIKKTYIEISSLNNEYLLFSQDNEVKFSMVNIRDSLISYNTTENWYIYHYKSAEKVEDIIVLEVFNGYTQKTDELWIKTIDHENGIQIWKDVIQLMNDSITTHYRYMAPLEYALTLPFLYVDNPMGLDSYYKGIDRVNWKLYFNE